VSPREKKLLIFFAIGGLVVINLLGYKFFAAKQLDIRSQHTQAVNQLKTAEMISASREEVESQMEWLAKNEPKPTDYQPVQTALQQLAEKEVTAVGLTLKTQKLLPTEQTAGLYFHRVKVQLTVLGTEQSLYQWFDHLNSPENLRCVTYIRLSPNKEDDTKIDCIAIVEQWFVPVPPAA
jgi:Tfp pilus assembly protein PilO